MNREERPENHPALEKADLYTRYPISTPWIYNGATVLHFGLGGVGLPTGYAFAGWIGTLTCPQHWVHFQLVCGKPVTFTRRSDPKRMSGSAVMDLPGRRA